MNNLFQRVLEATWSKIPNAAVLLIYYYYYYYYYYYHKLLLLGIIIIFRNYTDKSRLSKRQRCLSSGILLRVLFRLIGLVVSMSDY